jgi:hypothetical protein
MASHSALRIRYEYDKNGVRPVSRMRVAMIVPDPVTPPPQADQTGLWWELQDEHGNCLYHRLLHHSLGQDVEVFSKEPDEPVHRRPADEHGTFEVIVPDLPAGSAVALVGPHHSSGRLRNGPVRHKLADIPEAGGATTP